MQLRSIYLSRPGYGEDKDMLQGKFEITTQSGEITIKLDEEKAEQILRLITDQLVESAQEVANNLTKEIIEHKPALEDKSDEV